MTEKDGVDLILEQWQRERPELDHSPIGVVGRVFVVVLVVGLVIVIVVVVVIGHRGRV